MKRPAACPLIRTSHALPTLLLLALLAGGCHKGLTQGDIENRIFSAISEGRDAEHIESLLKQADDPAQAANRNILKVLQGIYVPRRSEGITHYQIAVLEVLVLYGGDLNRVTTPMGQSIICFWSHSPITPELLAWMLEHGLDPNLSCEADEWTALSHCARPGQSKLSYDQKYQMIKMLLEYGANPDVKSLGQPILDTLVTYHGDDPYLVDIIKLLLKAADDKGIEGYGDAVIAKALGVRRDEAAMVLLEHAESIDVPNKFGAPLINLAAAYDNVKSVELLIARGADIEAKDGSGYTPLHAAAAAGNGEIITMLLEAGAAVNPLNKKGQTPLDVARMDACGPRGKDRTQKVIDLLISHGGKCAAELK
ncbi:MAG TPA: ankyrin repeat domain-containing protein [Anaerohalosphaeraceae bacterium]|nr:ankyrin repeat domain-containing protein [Anaerohalosphaeraceae bacterium]HRT51283.1 ankyrin repeat domain-containing protein [Anaerohalosphaeraceae bacterium]HRT88140.1 ankyrin repeat domain-containing protein [Anaerohalosphaeraceae bacterium]